MNNDYVTDYSQPTKSVVELISPMKRGSVLDVGCGRGRNSLYLAQLGWDVTAIDDSPEVINELRTESGKQKQTIKIVLDNLLNFNPVQQFDVVLCLMTLHYVKSSEIPSAIERLKGWTMPNGYILITAFTDANKEGTRPYLFGEDELKNYFDDWEVRTYSEGPTSWVIPTGSNEKVRYMAAKVFARKPQEPSA